MFSKEGRYIGQRPLQLRIFSHRRRLPLCWASDLIAQFQYKHSCEDHSNSACMYLACLVRACLTKPLRRHWWEESLFRVLSKSPAS